MKARHHRVGVAERAVCIKKDFVIRAGITDSSILKDVNHSSFLLVFTLQRSILNSRNVNIVLFPHTKNGDQTDSSFDC